MLLPPDREEWERLCPEHIKPMCMYEEGLMPRNEHPLRVGMRVFDVLYCGKYDNAWGVVIDVREYEDGKIGVTVFVGTGHRYSSSHYWVPVPGTSATLSRRIGT